MWYLLRDILIVMKKKNSGFTLIELMVVISLIAILSTIGWAEFSKGSAVSRDAERRGDLRELQTALELYKNEFGRYPAGCNGAGGWSGQVGGGYGCSGVDSQYIVGLAPKFIKVLPTDPKLNSAVSFSGYAYAVDANGDVYKVVALDTVESAGGVLNTDKFFRCGGDFKLGVAGIGIPSFNDPGMCQATPSSPTGSCSGASSMKNECNNSTLFSKTFAVSGGFSRDDSSNSVSCPDRAIEYNTEQIRCK